MAEHKTFLNRFQLLLFQNFLENECFLCFSFWVCEEETPQVIAKKAKQLYLNASMKCNKLNFITCTYVCMYVCININARTGLKSLLRFHIKSFKKWCTESGLHLHKGLRRFSLLFHIIHFSPKNSKILWDGAIAQSFFFFSVFIATMPTGIQIHF